MDRNEAIARIKKALRQRSGKAWSVTGGHGTAWGWITITAPPARRTWSSRPLPHNPDGNLPGRANWEDYDCGRPGCDMSPADRAELGRLLGLEGPARHDGLRVPASTAYYVEHVDRAEGRTPSVIGVPYWD